MASIKKKNGKWEVRYDAGFDSLGKRIQKYKGGFDKKKDAENFLAETTNSINQGIYINPDKIFVFEYLDNWLEYQKENLSLSTYEGYEINIRCHIKPYIGGIRLQDLKPIHIKDLYSNLQKNRNIKIDGESRQMKKLSPKSILYVHRVLSKALEDATKDEIIYRNPSKAIKPPKVPKYKADFLTIEQIKEMLKKFKDDQLYIPVYLSVVLGLRRSEVLGLQWKHIDLKNKVVKIRYTLIMNKGNPVLTEKTKSDDSNRDIVITDRIAAELMVHRKRQARAIRIIDFKIPLIKPNKDIVEVVPDFVCTWPDGSYFNPSHISRSFNLRMQKYNLPSIRFHDLRHSNGALMVSANVPMKGASERLGHSTIVVTNDFYGHIENSVQKQIAEKIDEVIWGK